MGWRGAEIAPRDRKFMAIHTASSVPFPYPCQIDHTTYRTVKMKRRSPEPWRSRLVDNQPKHWQGGDKSRHFYKRVPALRIYSPAWMGISAEAGHKCATAPTGNETAGCSEKTAFEPKQTRHARTPRRFTHQYPQCSSPSGENTSLN